MSATVLVAWGPGEVRGILLEDDMPVELLVERERQGSLVDGVFLGRIERVVPSLPGAFVALGLDRPAFLPGTVALTEAARFWFR